MSPQKSLPTQRPIFMISPFKQTILPRDVNNKQTDKKTEHCLKGL